jgi:hypothetical protein
MLNGTFNHHIAHSSKGAKTLSNGSSPQKETKEESFSKFNIIYIID